MARLGNGPVKRHTHASYQPTALETHIAFVVAHPSPWNVIVLVVGDTALIVRALMEERALSGDAAYQGYCQRVGWHLVPGVF